MCSFPRKCMFSFPIITSCRHIHAYGQTLMVILLHNSSSPEGSRRPPPGPHTPDYRPQSSLVTFDTLQVAPCSIIGAHIKAQQGSNSQRVGLALAVLPEHPGSGPPAGSKRGQVDQWVPPSPEADRRPPVSLTNSSRCSYMAQGQSAQMLHLKHTRLLPPQL